MLVVAGISTLIFIAVCSLVGVRLLLLAHRTGRQEELLCGLGFTLIGLLGYPVTMVSGQGVGTVAETHVTLFLAGSFFTNCGLGCFYAFTGRVFRRGAVWAIGLNALGCGALAAGFLGNAGALLGASPDASSFEVTWAWHIPLQVASLGCFLWMSVEAVLEYRRSLRRRRLGLTDARSSNRFLLWTLFGASTMALSGVFAVVHWMGIPGVSSPVVHISSAVLGGLSSVAVLLAFLPPRFYRHWLAGSA